MKKLTMSILLALAVSVSAQTFTTTSKTKKQTKAAPPPPISERIPQGALQRGARGGNVLQMVNPKAPARYGTSTDSLIMDETGKWRGIKFIEILF
ncbi:MAG: hypothetical protein ABJB69_08500 [Spartobacteria bacterium]